jgi:hypothetical protein
MAETAYFEEHMDRYPGYAWIGGAIAYDDPCWFGDGLIRDLAAAWRGSTRRWPPDRARPKSHIPPSAGSVAYGTSILFS